MTTYFSDDLLNVLLVTGGHPFARDSFFDVFESNPEIAWSHVEHPAAQLLFNKESAKQFDAYVMYDMPGFDFHPEHLAPPVFHEPPKLFKDGLMDMLEAGQPFVFLHHACAAWPEWTDYAEIVGSKFLYQSTTLRGVERLDSGVNMDVDYQANPTCDHPITEGVGAFEINDELYLMEVFEDSVTPLYTSDFTFVKENFISAGHAVSHGADGSNPDGWDHAPGSNLVGWVKTYGNSPIVYLQFGHGPATYANENFRKVLANAIRWVSSEEAKNWARGKRAAA